MFVCCCFVFRGTHRSQLSIMRRAQAEGRKSSLDSSSRRRWSPVPSRGSVSSQETSISASTSKGGKERKKKRGRNVQSGECRHFPAALRAGFCTSMTLQLCALQKKQKKNCAGDAHLRSRETEDRGRSLTTTSHGSIPQTETELRAGDRTVSVIM